MKTLIILFAFCFLSFNNFSQSLEREVLATSGDFFNTLSGSLSYTIGEVVIETDFASNNILTQGFQQPRISDIVTTIYSIYHENNEVIIYPNPVSDLLNILISNANTTDFKVAFTNVVGQVITVPIYIDNPEKIRITADLYILRSGIYFITISSKEFNFKKKFIKL